MRTAEEKTRFQAERIASLRRLLGPELDIIEQKLRKGGRMPVPSPRSSVSLPQVVSFVGRRAWMTLIYVVGFERVTGMWIRPPNRFGIMPLGV